MPRLWIHLNKYEPVEKNREMIRAICTEPLDLKNFRYYIEVYRINNPQRQIDNRLKLEKLLLNLKKEHFVKFIFGNITIDQPTQIEFAIGDIYIPRIKDFRTLSGFCPWTNENFEKINGVFQRVYQKGILDFPIER